MVILVICQLIIRFRPVFQFWEKVLSPITILSLGQIKNIKWEKDFFLKNHSYGHSLWFCIKYGTVDKLLRTRLSGASKVHPQSSGDNALCIASDSDSDFQNSYHNQTILSWKILPISDLEFWQFWK